MKYITVTKFLEDIPEFRNEFSHFQWKTETVGLRFVYDTSVSDNDLYKFNGTLMTYFIRKCVCLKLDIPCIDDRTENIISKRNLFASESVHQDLCQNYEAYKNPNICPIYAIEDMKYVALSEELRSCKDKEPFENIVNMKVNVDNLQEIRKYVDKLPYKQVVYSKLSELPLNTGHILTGNPDFIFDEKIFCQTTTSKYYYEPQQKLAQVVLYIMAYYKEYYYGTAQEFIIEMYNPLLGNTHTTRLELTPEEFNRRLERVSTLAHNYYGQYN